MIKLPRLVELAAAVFMIPGTPPSAVASDVASASPPKVSGPNAPSGPSAPSVALSGSPYGLIWLDVDPGPAEISLDGDFLDAGVWLISVSPGEHDLRIRKTGFRSYAGHVAVPAGGSVHLDVRLQPGDAGDS